MKNRLLLAVVFVGFLALAAMIVDARTRGLGADAKMPKRLLLGTSVSDRSSLTGSKSSGSSLPVLSEGMPEFSDIGTWLNSDALTPDMLRGKVVLIDFCTYSCINCIRTLPHVTSWYEKYKGKQFVVVGIHTPEFAFEKEEKNIRDAISRHGVEYPVALDNAYGTWNAYGNRYWPAHYLFDAGGRLRYFHFGEGKYEETEAAIQSLLKEAGREVASKITEAPTPGFSNINSPETYLGYGRMAGLASPESVSRDAVSAYTKPPRLERNRFALSGPWKIEAERSISEGVTSLAYRYSASTANLVMGGPGKRVEVRLDGKPVPEAFLGTDVKAGADGRTYAVIDGERLYELTNGRGVYDEHVLELYFEAGISVYALTFG